MVTLELKSRPEGIPYVAYLYSDCLSLIDEKGQVVTVVGSIQFSSRYRLPNLNGSQTSIDINTGGDVWISFEPDGRFAAAVKDILKQKGDFVGRAVKTDRYYRARHEVIGGLLLFVVTSMYFLWGIGSSGEFLKRVMSNRSLWKGIRLGLFVSLAVAIHGIHTMFSCKEAEEDDG